MNKSILIKLAEQLEPKKFDFEENISSFSRKPFEAHQDKLYANYVKNYNRMMELLEKTNFSKIKDDLPNSDFAQLKRRVTWAANGAYLHELYFGNTTGENTKPGKCTIDLIKNDFASLKNFKDHFVGTSFVPPSGWAVWGYSLYDKKTQVVAVENHHNNCPIGFYPILVLDMWEHAYWADHLSNKKQYIEAFWEDIDWNVVEQRCSLVDSLFKKL